MTQIEQKTKGILELDLGGEKRCFKFGTLQIAMLMEMEKCNLQELIERLNDTNNFLLQIKYFYTAAVQYARLKKLPEPSFEEVGDWYDNMVIDQKKQLQEAAAATFQDPNESAPKVETEGQA